MKKIRFVSGAKLRRWIVPLVGAALFAVTLLAWEGLEKVTEAAAERYFYGAYEMVDRCLTAYYNNDPDTLLAQFPDYVMEWSASNTKLEPEALREQVRKSMQEQYEWRQQNGVEYEWEYIQWLDDVSDMDYSVLHAIGMQNIVMHQRIYRPIEVKIKETIGSKTTETVVRYLMIEKDNVWYTDLVNTIWLGQSLIPDSGMAPYQTLSDWLDAWYTGIHGNLLQGIPDAVINMKTGAAHHTDAERQDWELALMKYLVNQAAGDRQNGITHKWYSGNQEDLSGAELQKLQQEYQDACGLEITAAKRIWYTVWDEQAPKNYEEHPNVTWTTDKCTVIQLNGQWYMDGLHLPAAFTGIWNLSADASK